MGRGFVITCGGTGGHIYPGIAVAERLRALMPDCRILFVGGAGNMEHFKTLFETVPQVDAGLAASIFHRKEVPLPALKKYLAGEGIPMRILRTGV